jgi:hypothetical protein
MRLAMIAAAVLSGSASAQLFAVAPGPRLVTVDPDTGLVGEIGAMEPGVRIASMEFVGQRLYAIDTDFPGGAWLIELDPRTGETLSRHEVTLDGSTLQNAVEGLGYDPAADTLLQGFWRPGANNSSTSNTMAALAMDGTLTAAVGYGANADFDGLATRAGDGSMYFVDREPGPNTVEIGLVSHGGPMSSLVVYAFNAELNGVNDVSLDPERGELLAVDAVTARVHRFDPGTAALLGSELVSTGEGLNVAAYRVPCPADLDSPYGVLDLSDVNAFIAAFVAGGHPADLAEPLGVLDLSDVNAFVGSFVGGCP